MTEGNAIDATSGSPLGELPPVPGGWGLREFRFAERSLQVFAPAHLERLFGDAIDETEAVPYWARLWPAAEPAARALLAWASWPAGAEVLELGSGVGLVGLASVARGDRVLFSDISASALKACRINARQNGFPDPPVRLLDWRELTEIRADVVLACDVLYDAALHEPLLNTIGAALRPGGVAWIADPGRHASRAFASRAAEAFELRIRSAAGTDLLLPSRTEFQIFELHPRRIESP